MKLTDDERRVVEDHLYLVHDIARRTECSLDFDDRMQEGTLGLIGAAQTYDPSYGVPFTAWARRKIAWAIVDGVRKLAGREEGAGAENQRLKRAAWRRRVSPDRFVDPPVPLAASVPDHADAVAEALLPASEELTRVLAALPSLRPGDRLVIEARLEGKSLSQIGAEQGYTESRAQQRWRRGTDRLREIAA